MSHLYQNMNTKPVELITLSECARRTGNCLMTLRRAVARRGIAPDALLVEGRTQRLSPLFVESRLPELAGLVGPKIH
jgi:hypothetical protein